MDSKLTGRLASNYDATLQVSNGSFHVGLVLTYYVDGPSVAPR